MPGSRDGFKGCWKIDGVKQTLPEKAKMQVLEFPNGPVLLELTTENGGITIDAVNKDYYVVFEADQSSSLPFETFPKNFWFSIKFHNTLTPDISYTLAYGWLASRFPEITK